MNDSSVFSWFLANAPEFSLCCICILWLACFGVAIGFAIKKQSEREQAQAYYDLGIMPSITIHPFPESCNVCGRPARFHILSESPESRQPAGEFDGQIKQSLCDDCFQRRRP